MFFLDLPISIHGEYNHPTDLRQPWNADNDDYYKNSYLFNVQRFTNTISGCTSMPIFNSIYANIKARSNKVDISPGCVSVCSTLRPSTTSTIKFTFVYVLRLITKALLSAAAK
ncbi:unnamed protein product [Rotaria socialis]